LGHYYLKGRSVFITKDRADRFRPILKWIRRSAPGKKEQLQASRILREIEGIKEHKQIVLPKGEFDMLTFIATEFPDGVETGRQLGLPNFEED